MKHAAAIPSDLQVAVDGDSLYTSYYIYAKTDLNETVFVPEYLLIEAQTLDQYGEPMEDRYTCTYVPVIGDVEGKPQQLIGMDAVL